MVGYIGSKAVTLSTTAADVAGDATINGDLTVKGTTVTIDSAAVQEIRLGDNDKMTFGDATGGDLQIYHDGSNSYIDDVGTGGLIVRADNFYVRKANDVENMIIGSADGAVTLYHDNATKLATTSTGVDITGTLTSDGLTVDGTSQFDNYSSTSGKGRIQFGNSGQQYIEGYDTGNAGSGSYLSFGQNTSERMRIDSSGNVGIGTSSPSSFNGGANNLVVGSGSGSEGITIYADNASNSAIFFADTDSTTTGQLNYQHASNAMTFHTNGGSEHMRIDSSGQVGINTTTPNNYYAKKLVIDIGSDIQNGMTIVSGTSASGMIAFADGTSGASAYRGYFNYSHASDYLAFGTGGTEAMRLDANGSMALGDSNATRHGQATKALIYNGSGTAAEAALHCSRGGTGTEFQVAFSNAYGVRGTITTTASAVAYNTTSDYRLKENVTDVTDGITRVKQLAPKRFNFIVDPDTTVDGFIAHEVQDVIPEAISGAKDAMRDEEYEVTPAVEATFDEDGNVLTEAVDAVMGTRSVPDYQGIDQSKLVPLLTAALQEAIAKIETLETEMTSVKARLDALEAE